MQQNELGKKRGKRPEEKEKEKAGGRETECCEYMKYHHQQACS